MIYGYSEKRNIACQFRSSDMPDVLKGIRSAKFIRSTVRSVILYYIRARGLEGLFYDIVKYV